MKIIITPYIAVGIRFLIALFQAGLLCMAEPSVEATALWLIPGTRCSSVLVPSNPRGEWNSHKTFGSSLGSAIYQPRGLGLVTAVCLEPQFSHP